MGATVRIGGEARELLDELKKVQREFLAQKKVQQELTTESKQLSRIATKAFRDTRTEGERYKESLGDLRKALKGGALDTETYRRAADKLKREFRDAASAQDKLAESNEETFGATALSKLGGYAAGIVSVTAVVGLMRDALAGAADEANKLADQQRTSLDQVGRLQQVSATPQEFGTNVDLARKLRESGAVDTLGEGADVVFALDSSGLKDQFEFFNQILISRFEPNVTGLIGAVEKNVTNFGLTAEQATDKGLVASSITQNTLAEVLRESARSAQSARTIGLDADENLGLVSVLSKTAKSIEQGGTQAEGFLTAVDKLDIRSDSFEGVFNALQTRLDAGETERELFPDKEGLAGFRALRESRGLLDATTGQIAGSEGETRRRQFALDNDFTRTLIDDQQTRGEDEIAKESIGTQQALRDSIRKLTDTIQFELGAGAVSRFIDRRLAGTAQLVGADSLLTNASQQAGFRLDAARQGNTSVIEKIDRLERLGARNAAIERGEQLPVTQVETPAQ